MKFFGLTLFFLFLTAGSLLADAPVLSSKATVSLLTCGPGEALYEAFGHSAVRIQDPVQGLDVVFNYGVFDFNQENFYLNFARGNMLYCLGISQTGDFLYAYRNYGRAVREQVLNLDSAERMVIFRYLDINLLPENKNYLYNYFRNNCSTKIPEMMDSALKGRIIWEHAAISGKASFRSMIYDYTEFQEWGRLGIDLGLGAVIDQRIEGKDLNFLPYELEKSFSRARIKRAMTEFPLVLENRILYEPPVFFASNNYFLSPAFLFTMLLLMAAASWYFSAKVPVLFRAYRSILYLGTGLLGLTELCIWIFTNHTDAAWNLNLLWACPLFIPLGAVSFFRESWGKRFFGMLKIWLPLVLAFWFFLPQTLNSSLIPLVAALLVLSFDPIKPAADTGTQQA
jgi:hypothetical protein